MTSAKKKPEELCDRCANQSKCDNKPAEGALVLLRCLDFAAKEGSEEKK